MRKVPSYPRTPAINCQYCRHFNAKSLTCTAPNAERIANFHPREDADCILFKYEIAEPPEENTGDFVAKYCVGTKCPFYYNTANLCTRPSKCPYKDNEQKSVFETLNFEKEI